MVVPIIATALSQIGSQITKAISPMKALTETINGVVEPLTLLIEPFQTFGDIIGSTIYPAIQPLSDALYNLTPLVETVSTSIGDQLTPIISSLTPVITELGPPIIQIIGIFAFALIPIFNGFVPVILALVPVVVQLMNAFIPILPALLPLIFPIISLANVLSMLLPAIQMIIPPIMSLIGIFANTLLPPITMAINVIATLGTTIASIFAGGGFDAVINWFKTVPKQILDAITSGATDFGNKVKDWWNDLWD